MPIDFRVLVLDSRSYARSGGRPRLRLVGANIPVKEALGEDRHVRLRGSEQRDSHYQGVAFGGRCGYLRGARVARLGGHAVRRGLPLFLKRMPRVPDPGQPVDLRMEDGSWRRGFRAISEPSTTEWEEVVWIATEDEYRAARGEGRSAVGVPWPTERMVVSSSGPPWRLPHPAPPRSLQGARRRSWTGKRSADLEEGDVAFELWILLAIALLTAVAAAYSLLTATGVLGGG